jgi:hypothetical protein
LTLSLIILPGCAKAPVKTSTPANPASDPTTTIPTTQAAPSNLTVLSIAGGDIQILKQGSSSWKKGEPGMTLDIGDRLKTGAGSKARITFFEGSTIELEGDTSISLLELGINADQSTAVKVKQEVGKTLSQAKKLLDTRDRYEVETPAAVAAVRGSTMYVEVALDGRTFVGNVEGKIVVIAQGIETKLLPDTHTNIVPGQLAGTPEPGATPPPTTTPPVTSVAPPTTVKPTPTTPTKTTTAPTTTPPAPTTTKPALTIRIVSLKQGDLVGRAVIVSGVVNDPTVTEAVLTLNGTPVTISVVNGNFSTTVTLADGTNSISVSVTRDGVTASDYVTLDPANPT